MRQMRIASEKPVELRTSYPASSTPLWDRGGKFFLHDSSRNGTYVHAEGTEPLRILREDIVLATAGNIHPGSPDTRPIRYALRRTP